MKQRQNVTPLTSVMCMFSIRFVGLTVYTLKLSADKTMYRVEVCLTLCVVHKHRRQVDRERDRSAPPTPFLSRISQRKAFTQHVMLNVYPTTYKPGILLIVITRPTSFSNAKWHKVTRIYCWETND